MIDLKESIISCILNNKGKTVGFICGLIFGILLLTIGWKAFILAICVGLGLWIGNFHDKRENFIEFLDKILPNFMNK